MDLNADDKRRMNGLRQRLDIIAQRYPQAEIARRTGASRSNVSRYLRGTRMPADFTTALVEQFSVNPDWLLTGNGSPWIEDIPPDTAALAGNLLDIVKAMAAVEQMQLGAIAGKNHLKLLRELSDALSRYEDLSKRLNRLSGPILRTVLDDLRRELEKPNLKYASQISRTVEQLGRFNDDPELTFEHLMLQARLALLEADLPRALELTRRAVVLTFHSGGQVGAHDLEAVAECVTALHDWVRFAEAKRVAEAAMALASEEVRNSPAGHWISALIADMHVHSGELHKGIPDLTRVRGLLDGLWGLHADGMLAHALLYAGAVDVSTAIALGGDSVGKAERILGFASFMEDPDDVELALDYLNKVLGPEVDSWALWRSRIQLRAVRGETKGLDAEFERFLKAKPPGIDYLLPFDPVPLVTTQYQRLTGKGKLARQSLRKSERMLTKLPDWFYLTVMWQARHMRNVLELGTPQQQRAAREFFQQSVANGYLCFMRFT